MRCCLWEGGGEQQPSPEHVPLLALYASFLPGPDRRRVFSEYMECAWVFVWLVGWGGRRMDGWVGRAGRGGGWTDARRGRGQATRRKTPPRTTHPTLQSSLPPSSSLLLTHCTTLHYTTTTHRRARLVPLILILLTHCTTLLYNTHRRARLLPPRAVPGAGPGLHGPPRRRHRRRRGNYVCFSFCLVVVL